MIRVLDGTQGEIQIEVEYRIYLTNERADVISRYAMDNLVMAEDPSGYWWLSVQDGQYYCKQNIVVVYPFSENLIDKIRELWDSFVLDSDDIDHVHITKIHSMSYQIS